MTRPSPQVALSGPLRLVIWTTMPTHHQSAFFAALRESGIELRVCYVSHVTAERRELGWQVPESLPVGEQYVIPRLSRLRLAAAWRDHVHVVAGSASRFLQLLVLRLSMLGVPWVHWSEPAPPCGPASPRYWLRRLYGALVNRCAVGAFAIGDRARVDFERWGIDASRIRFLPYSIAGLVAPPQPTPDIPGATRFVQVGKLCKGKGIDVLLQAFAALRSRWPETRLELVGHGPSEAEYRALAARLGIALAVHFVGRVPAPEVARHIGRADVLVLASRCDGWGVVLNEGASLGKALVATDATGAAYHLIQEAENGFRVPTADAQALATALESYCADPALAARHGRASARIFTEFTPEANAARLRQGLASLLADR